MGKKFRELVGSLPEQRLRRIRKTTESILADITLNELRRARELSQEDLPRTMGVADIDP